MADEGDFMELLIASERVGEWLDTIQSCTKQNVQSKKCKRAISELLQAMIERETYREEARENGAAAIFADALAAIQADLELKEALEKSLQVCSGTELSQKVKEYTFGVEKVLQVEGRLGYGVGGRVWGAAQLCCQAMEDKHRSWFAGCEVLELGSGTGLCGILAAKLGATRVVLTDCFGGVLRNLDDCVALNHNHDVKMMNAAEEKDVPSAASQTGTRSYKHGVMEVRYLDWGEESVESTVAGEGSEGGRGGQVPEVDVSGLAEPNMPPRLEDTETFPLVLASDLLYEAAHGPTLACAVVRRLRKEGKGVLFLPVRDASIMTAFLKTLASSGLHFCIQSVDESIWNHEGIRGSCDYEGGFNWVFVEWIDAPASDWGIDLLFSQSIPFAVS